MEADANVSESEASVSSVLLNHGPLDPPVITPAVHVSSSTTQHACASFCRAWNVSTLGGNTIRSNESNPNLFYTSVLTITKIAETNKGCMVFINPQQHDLTPLPTAKFSFQILY